MNFSLTRNRIIILGIFVVVGIIIFLLFSGVLPGLRLTRQGATKAKLTVWGVFDDRQVWQKLIDQYRGNSSNIDITYVDKGNDAERYEKELLDALAAGKGPDIFMIHNTWLPKHINKIVPLKEEAYPYSQFEGIFPQVVAQDFARNNTVFASPLYLDTLAMFYNKDFLDRKGIATLPQNWDEFQGVVRRLRELNPSTNEILKAGAAIGGTETSINRATDLLSLIMLQNGTRMVSTDYNEATFNSYTTNGINPGLESLKFYTSFANPSSPLYTWQERFPYSIDSFASGDTAIIFNYAHQTPVITSKNPFLNFGVAPVPQVAGAMQPVNYANYWGLAVSNKSQTQDVAWNFILSVTTNPSLATTYARESKKPPALRILINNLLTDVTYGVFAKQALTARSWQQVDNIAVENSFSNMIGAVVSGQLTPDVAIKKASDEISSLMRSNTYGY